MSELYSKKETKVVIDRVKWARKDQSGREINFDCDNALLNEEGGLCCLGFYCNQVKKIPLKNLKEKGSPEDLDNPIGTQDDWLPVIRLNDRCGVSDEVGTNKQQESKIKKWFKENLNCRVIFEGRTPRPKKREYEENYESLDW